MLKTLHREEDSLYLLQYEKKKMQECADTLQNLANAFLIEEKEEQEEQREADRQNLFFKKRLQENRVLLADHLKEMAKMISSVSREKIKIISLEERQKKQMIKTLLSEGLIVENFCFLQKENGRKEVVIRMYQNNHLRKNKFCSSDEVGAFLSVLLNVRLVPTSQTPFFIMDKPTDYYYEEDSKYIVMTGFAKAVKEEEKVSGDNFSFLETQDRKIFGILSDGMGSGEKACKDSEVVIEMAERFLEAGFSMELTVQMINDYLLAGSEGKNMSTLDLCSINLYSAEAEFLKVGATYSLLKRDGYVEKIPSISLPLGIFHELEMNGQKKQLLDGDYIFLFSDGMLDYFYGEEGEEFLKDIIKDIPMKRPTEMAGYLMKHAVSSAKGKIRDDMTVLVMGIWENIV